MCCRYVFGRFQFSLDYQEEREHLFTPLEKSQYRTIPTFLTLFIFGYLYILVLTWDALRLKNTIQIIGLCFSNLALFVYSVLQIDQIDKSIQKLLAAGAIKPDKEDRNVWALCKPFLIAIPVVVGVVTVAMSVLAYQLYREFAWDILKLIGADDSLARPVRLRELNLPAARPANSALLQRKAAGIAESLLEPWQSALHRFLRMTVHK